VHHFQGRHRRLALLAEGMEEDMHRTLKTNGGDLQRLLPIQRALTEIAHDVKEAREAVEGAVDSDAALNAARRPPARPPQPASSRLNQGAVTQGSRKKRCVRVAR